MKRRRGTGRKGEVGWRPCGARAWEGWPSQPGPRPTVALGVAGKDGAPVSAPSPSAGPSQLLPLPLRDPRALPLPERPEALPSQLSSGPSSAALVRASVQQGLPPGSRADGRTGGTGWAVSGRRASLRPSRAARPLSVLGRANGAGGRLRAPHTTVLTEGSERLSGPVISVGWYCCKIEIQTRRPLARPPGARAGPGRVGRPAGRPAGRRARPGGGWGALLPRPRRAPGLCVGRAAVPSVCLSVCGGGGRGGRAGRLSCPYAGHTSAAGPPPSQQRVAAALCLFGFAKRRVHPRCSINKNQQSIPAGPAGRQGPSPERPVPPWPRPATGQGQRISAAALTPPLPTEPPTQASLRAGAQPETVGGLGCPPLPSPQLAVSPVIPAGPASPRCHVAPELAWRVVPGEARARSLLGACPGTGTLRVSELRPGQLRGL